MSEPTMKSAEQWNREWLVKTGKLGRHSACCCEHCIAKPQPELIEFFSAIQQDTRAPLEQQIARLTAEVAELRRELQHLVNLVDPALDNGVQIPGLATLNGAKAALRGQAGSSGGPGQQSRS